MPRVQIAVLASALAFLGVAASAASAAVIRRDYPIFQTGIELTYGAVIYDPEDGTDPINLEGFPLTRVQADITYTPEAGEDIDSLIIQMLVPVVDSTEEFLEITGSEFTETSTPGTWHYALDTDKYNGTIRGGRWSLTTYSADPITGDPFGTNGAFAPGSAITLVVSTPEPATLGALAAGLTLVGRRRR